MAIHMTSRMRIAHGVPYVAMETTEEAVPTITSPMMQSSATTTSRTVESASSRPATRTPAADARGVAVVAGGAVLDRGGP